MSQSGTGLVHVGLELLWPYCPVAKKKAVGHKRGAGKISEVNADHADISSVGTKSGRGPKTGVHLRYHASPEYKKLTQDERAELHEWHETPEGKAATIKGKTNKRGGGGGKGKEVHFSEKAIAAAVDKKLAAKKKATLDEKSTNVAQAKSLRLTPITLTFLLLEPNLAVALRQASTFVITPLQSTRSSRRMKGRSSMNGARHRRERPLQ
jgi:hypothetical protein